MRHKTTTADAETDRWRGRPGLSRLLTAAIVAVPVAVSIAAATVTSRLLPRAHGTLWTLAWWAAVLGIPLVVLASTDRVVRRAMPLALLLKMTLVFPDQAPKRLAVARKAGGTRDLARRVEEARIHGIDDEPVLAAEKILALAAALNTHDRTTRGHGERVRTFTDLIAEELDLPEADRDRLRWSALLHDIGKLAVHPDILNKPGKPNDDEWAVIKNHPLEGERLTAPLAGWLGPWAKTVAEHHEKYDGSGYPYGLAGEQISYGARIVAVADCYDTMTSIRSYKRPISPEAARSELASCAGSHFDSKVVRAFLDISIGRLRRVAGPLTWIGSLPMASSAGRLSQVADGLARLGAAAAVIVGATTMGLLHNPANATAAPVRDAPTSPSAAATKASGDGPAGKLRTDAITGGIAASRGDSPVSDASPDAVGGSTDATSTASVPGSSAARGAGATTTTRTGTGSGTTTTTVVAGAPTTTVPTSQPSLSIINGGAQAGRPQRGDQIILTFASAPDQATLCAAWSPTSSGDLAGPNVVVQGNHPGSGNDTLTVTDTGDCTGGFHFGTIDLGQRGYFSASATFGGPSSKCTTATTTECSSIHWTGANTLTITLGKESSGQPTRNTPSVAVFSPDPALQLSGTISSLNTAHF